jgi:hypothetical protein
MESARTASATCKERSRLFVNSGVAQNFANQRPVIPTGGNWMNGVGFRANTATTASGASRKNRTPIFVAR